MVNNKEDLVKNRKYSGDFSSSVNSSSNDLFWKLNKNENQEYFDTISQFSYRKRDFSMKSKNKTSPMPDSVAIQETLIQSKIIEQRMRKEIKILRDENQQLRIQTQKMKVFVPISLFPTNTDHPIQNQKSWEIAAKIMKPGNNVKNWQKLKYLENCLQELIQRHYAMKSWVLKTLQEKWEENEKLEENIDLLNAKIEGYLAEIEHNKIHCKLSIFISEFNVI